MASESKRRFLYNKWLALNTFVFFFHNGPSETSWSVRDYSTPGSVRLCYSSNFQDAAGRIPPASEIRAAAEWDLPATAHPTTDLDHWHVAIREKNSEYLTDKGQSAHPAVIPVPQTVSVASAAEPFPVLNLPKLLASPKAQKRLDIKRILFASSSED